LQEWAGYEDKIGHREEYIHEDIRLEGRADAQHLVVCPTCADVAEASHPPLFRCEECFGGLLECQACCIRRHQRLPLHIIQVSFVLLVAQVQLAERMYAEMDRHVLQKDLAQRSRPPHSAWASGPVVCQSSTRTQGVHCDSYQRNPSSRGRLLQLRATHLETTPVTPPRMVSCHSSLSTNLLHGTRLRAISHPHTHWQALWARFLPIPGTSYG
jgi:hypothetical protein